MNIVFMGTPEFSVPTLNKIIDSKYTIKAVVTQPDKHAGRGKKLTSPPVKEIAISNNIPVVQPTKVRTKEFFATIKRFNPDVIVTVAYGRLLTKQILDIPKHGCINVHASLLPKYRGAAPINYAIINGENESGITTMYMDEGMDTGDILLQESVKIDISMTAGELHDILAKQGSLLLIKTLDMLRSGRLKRIPQNDAGATYAPVMSRNTGFINWSKSSREIHNLIRGTNPWPAAYTIYKNKRMKIWETQCSMEKNNGMKPGFISSSSVDGVCVSCGEGTLIIKQIQMENSRRMAIEECWHNIEKGELFG